MRYRRRDMGRFLIWYIAVGCVINAIIIALLLIVECQIDELEQQFSLAIDSLDRHITLLINMGQHK